MHFFICHTLLAAEALIRPEPLQSSWAPPAAVRVTESHRGPDAEERQGSYPSAFVG